MISYKVTNDKKFRKVEDIDTSLLTGGYMYNNPANTYFSGTLMISVDGGKHHIITGQHSANDYQDDYGFVLTFTED